MPGGMDGLRLAVERCVITGQRQYYHYVWAQTSGRCRSSDGARSGGGAHQPAQGVEGHHSRRCVDQFIGPGDDLIASPVLAAKRENPELGEGASGFFRCRY